MKRLRHRAAARCLLLSISLATIAGAAPAAGTDGAVPTLPLRDVRPGMAATVRTVLAGSEPEELPAEILGVMENALGPGRSLILARLGGERATFTGIAGGMSGSPVYVDGRLIGALSYRIGQFTKEAIAGITPIEYMLEIASAGVAGSEPRVASGRASPLRTTIPLVGSGGGTSAAAAAGAELVAIETPLVVTGLGPDLLAHFGPGIAALGAVAVSGAGGSAPGAGAPGRAPAPGDAIAAQLVRGDLSVAATGTVTHVDGDRVLAFGHPFLLQGAAEFPMARAEIYTTLASLAGSNKLARVLETIGTWEQIRLPGIFGVTSRVPSMIPMSVTLKTPARTTSYSYEVASHRDWTPILIAISVAGSLVNTPSFTDESTLSVSARIHLEGHPDVVLQDLYTGFAAGSSAALATASDLQGISGAIFGNRFEAPKVRSIEVTAEGIEEGRLSFVEGVWPSRTEAAPGEEVRFDVRVRSFRGEIETKSFVFHVPESAPRGDLQVIIGGGSYLLAAERQTLARRVAGADSLDQIIGIVNQLRPGDTLYAKAIRRLPGAVVQSEVLPGLPPSVLTTLRANRGSGEISAIAEAPVWEDRIALQSIVNGGAVLVLRIR